MGGQETLLLLARHPDLLAGAAAFSSVTDLALQYRNFHRVRCKNACRTLHGTQFGSTLRKIARREIGGGPGTRRAAYAARSPMTYVRAIAALLRAAAAVVERLRPDRGRPAVPVGQLSGSCAG